MTGPGRSWQTPEGHVSWGGGIVDRATADNVTLLWDTAGVKPGELALAREGNPIERCDAV